MMAGGSAPINLYPINEWLDIGGWPTFRDATGRTVVETPIVAGEKTLVLLNVSQSNAANSLETPYTVLNPTKVLCLNPFDGVVTQCADPILGATDDGPGASMIGKLGDLCVGDGSFDKFICCNIPVGGSSVNDWKSSGRLHHRLITGIRRKRDLINAAPDGAIICPAVFSLLGETDGVNNLPQSAWEAGFREMAAALPGQNVNWPWFVGKCTFANDTIDATVQAAQAAVVNGTTIFAGADTDDITGAGRKDSAHFSNIGRDIAAAKWKVVFASFYA
jgi:hypothetical protein